MVVRTSEVERRGLAVTDQRINGPTDQSASQAIATSCQQLTFLFTKWPVTLAVGYALTCHPLYWVTCFNFAANHSACNVWKKAQMGPER
jgi:hypothetical protein